MKNIKHMTMWLPALALLLTPIFSFAAIENIEELVRSTGDIIGTAIPVTVGAGLLVFLWGLVKRIGSGDSEENRREGRWIMAFGILIIFVMVSIGGIVSFIAGSLLPDGSGPLQPPCVNFSGSDCGPPGTPLPIID